MDRRSLLKIGGVAPLSLVAGCASLSGNSRAGIVVSKITIRNRTDRSVPVSVLLADTEQIVFWRSVTVESAPNQFEIFNELPRSPHEYILYIHVPGVEQDTGERADLVDEAGDKSCVELGLDIVMADRDGTEVPTVYYARTGHCHNQSR